MKKFSFLYFILSISIVTIYTSCNLNSVSFSKGKIPSRPTIISVESKSNSLIVTYADPDLNLDPPITRHTFYITKGDNLADTKIIEDTTNLKPFTITGLENGTGYLIEITATNSKGTSEKSLKSALVKPFLSESFISGNIDYKLNYIDNYTLTYQPIDENKLQSGCSILAPFYDAWETALDHFNTNINDRYNFVKWYEMVKTSKIPDNYNANSSTMTQYDYRYKNHIRVVYESNAQTWFIDFPKLFITKNDIIENYKKFSLKRISETKQESILNNKNTINIPIDLGKKYIPTPRFGKDTSKTSLSLQVHFSTNAIFTDKYKNTYSNLKIDPEVDYEILAQYASTNITKISLTFDKDTVFKNITSGNGLVIGSALIDKDKDNNVTITIMTKADMAIDLTKNFTLTVENNKLSIPLCDYSFMFTKD